MESPCSLPQQRWGKRRPGGGWRDKSLGSCWFIVNWFIRCGQDDIKTGTDWGWIISQFSRNQSSWRDTEALAAHMLCSLIVNIPDIWSPEPGTSAGQGRRRRVPVSWILTQVAEYCFFYHPSVQPCRCVSLLTKHMQIFNILMFYSVYSTIISIHLRHFWLPCQRIVRLPRTAESHAASQSGDTLLVRLRHTTQEVGGGKY